MVTGPATRRGEAKLPDHPRPIFLRGCGVSGSRAPGQPGCLVYQQPLVSGVHPASGGSGTKSWSAVQGHLPLAYCPHLWKVQSPLQEFSPCT